MILNDRYASRVSLYTIFSYVHRLSNSLSSFHRVNVKLNAQRWTKAERVKPYPLLVIRNVLASTNRSYDKIVQVFLCAEKNASVEYSSRIWIHFAWRIVPVPVPLFLLRNENWLSSNRSSPSLRFSFYREINSKHKPSLSSNVSSSGNPTTRLKGNSYEWINGLCSPKLSLFRGSPFEKVSLVPPFNHLFFSGPRWSEILANSVLIDSLRICSLARSCISNSPLDSLNSFWIFSRGLVPIISLLDFHVAFYLIGLYEEQMQSGVLVPDREIRSWGGRTVVTLITEGIESRSGRKNVQMMIDNNCWGEKWG